MTQHSKKDMVTQHKKQQLQQTVQQAKEGSAYLERPVVKEAARQCHPSILSFHTLQSSKSNMQHSAWLVAPWSEKHHKLINMQHNTWLVAPFFLKKKNNKTNITNRSACSLMPGYQLLGLKNIRNRSTCSTMPGQQPFSLKNIKK